MIPTNYNEFAEIYDVEYIDYPACANDINFYLHFAKNAKSKILDLGCGTGRIALNLAQNGYDIIGIDISDKMLEKAKSKAKILDQNVQSHVKFHLSDMEHFDTGETYNLAYIGFRSFMLVLNTQKQREILKNVNRHLNQYGILIISFFVPTLERLIKYIDAKKGEYSLVREFPHPNGVDKIVEYELKSYNEYQQIAYHNLKHVTINNNGEYISETFRNLNIRMTTKYEFQYLAEICGFQVIDIYSNYFFKPFDEKSKEMIWILRKQL